MKNTERTPQELKETTAMFLKFIFNATQNKSVPISITDIANKYKVPYERCIPTVIIQTGIIKATERHYNQRYYTWNTVEPSLSMAHALILKAREYTIKSQIKSVTKKQKISINTTPPTKELNTNDIKPTITRLKAGLVALGFTELEAKEIIISKFI